MNTVTSKNRIVNLLIIVSMFLLMFPPSDISASDNSGIHNQMSIKKIYGTLSEIEQSLSERAANETKQLYDTPLQGSQLKDYQERVKVKIDAASIRNTIEKHSDTFSGMYYQPDKGTIVVLTTQDSQDVRNTLYKDITHKDKIEFKVVKYSKKDLDDAQNTIREKTPKGIIQALIPDVTNNRLIVSLSELTDENKSIVHSMAKNSDIIEFIPPIKIEIQTPDETNYGDPFPVGSRISRYFTQDGATYRGTCTTGYFGINQNDHDVLVTAGHCDDVGSTSSWFQPDNSAPGNSIGNWSFRTTSSLPDGTDRTSDAGYIRLSGRNGMPYVPYPSNDMTPITGIYLNDLVNDTVYLRGATTGALVAGQINYAGVDVWLGDHEYGYLRSLILASYNSLGGDSGGTIVADYAWDSALQSYTFDLAGTHMGRLTVRDHDVITDGNYALYNPLWTTFSDLNLSGLYLIQ